MKNAAIAVWVIVFVIFDLGIYGAMQTDQARTDRLGGNIAPQKFATLTINEPKANVATRFDGAALIITYNLDPWMMAIGTAEMAFRMQLKNLVPGLPLHPRYSCGATGSFRQSRTIRSFESDLRGGGKGEFFEVPFRQNAAQMDGRERVPQDDHWCRAELSEGHSPYRIGEIYVSPNSIEGGYMKQQHSYKGISNPNTRFGAAKNWDLFHKMDLPPEYNGMPPHWQRVLFFPDGKVR